MTEIIKEKHKWETREEVFQTIGEDGYHYKIKYKECKICGRRKND